MQQYLQQYGEYVYHLAYLYVKDRQFAEEIAQDVFYNLIKKKQQFRGDAHLKTYLTRMTINRAHDELRKIKRRTILQKVLPFSKVEPSAEKHVMSQQTGQSLRDAVFALPVHYREVIILHYYEDFTINEITLLLGLGENTIRTRLRRAKQQLKNELGELMEEGLLHD